MEDANGGEAGENESQHGGEEARREETKGAEEEEVRWEANLKWKIVGCTANGGRRKRGRRKVFFKKIYYLLFLNEG